MMEIKSEFSTKKPAYPVLAAVAGAAVVALCGCLDKKQGLGGSVPNPHAPYPKAPAKPQVLDSSAVSPGHREG